MAASATPPSVSRSGHAGSAAAFEDAGSVAGSQAASAAASAADTGAHGNLDIVPRAPAGGFTRQCCFGCGPPGPASHFNNIGNDKYIKWACKPCDNARRQWEARRGCSLWA